MDFYFDLLLSTGQTRCDLLKRDVTGTGGGGVFFRGPVAHQMAITPSYTRCEAKWLSNMHWMRGCFVHKLKPKNHPVQQHKQGIAMH